MPAICEVLIWLFGLNSLMGGDEGLRTACENIEEELNKASQCKFLGMAADYYHCGLWSFL